LRTVADLIEEQELRELEAEASALLVKLETTLSVIRALKEARA